MIASAAPMQSLNDEAKSRFRSLEGRPLFLSDWLRALFIHYEVDPAALQPFVPFDLDLRDGRAYVSLVAFAIHRLRPRFGGAISEALFKPIATHGFLNVRTYVRRGDESGIYFLAEWLPNRFSILLGPGMFLLPYQYGRLDYRHEHEKGRVEGEVIPASGRGKLRYRARINGDGFAPCERGSLDEFLLERYIAFTHRRGADGLFRIWHKPWPQTRAEAQVDEASAVAATGDWFRAARLAGANYSTGVEDVWIGGPRRLGRRA